MSQKYPPNHVNVALLETEEALRQETGVHADQSRRLN